MEDNGNTVVVGQGPGGTIGSTGPSSLNSCFFYRLSIDVHYGGGANAKMSAVVLVKRGGVTVLEAEKPLQSQVRVLTLSEGSPYEQLHDYVSAAVSPYFKSFVKVRSMSQ